MGHPRDVAEGWFWQHSAHFGGVPHTSASCTTNPQEQPDPVRACAGHPRLES